MDSSNSFKPDEFKTAGYQAINKARLDHLDNLGLNLYSKSVLELGAGVGDLTQFWLDRRCTVTCVEGRYTNAKQIRDRYGDQLDRVSIFVQDLDHPDWAMTRHDIVFAYGTLYHLLNPIAALARWTQSTRDLLLLETVVSRDETILRDEDPASATACLGGKCQWLSRAELALALCKLFPCVYEPVAPPKHEEFPSNWDKLPAGDGLVRQVYVCSKFSLGINEKLRSIK